MRPMHSAKGGDGGARGAAGDVDAKVRPRLGPRLCRWTLIKSGCSNRSAKIFVQILELCFWPFFFCTFCLFYFFFGRGCRWAASSVAFISHAERSRHHETLFKTLDSSTGLYRAQFISQVFHVRGLKPKPRRDGRGDGDSLPGKRFNSGFLRIERGGAFAIFLLGQRDTPAASAAWAHKKANL